MSKARELANLGNAYSDGALSNRNLIINGAMQVAQRGTSFSGLSNSPVFGLDRWSYRRSGGWPSLSGSFDQVLDAPDGFTHSLKYTVNTADTSTTGNGAAISQNFERYNVLQLAYGTSAAKDFTVSFWVKSSVAGEYSLTALANGSVGLKYTATYDVSNANVWEYKTITVSGNTVEAIPDTSLNSAGLHLYWVLGSGETTTNLNTWQDLSGLVKATTSVDLTSTANATFQITGVQLEVGDTATPFEHRSYGQELALCQRYYFNTYTAQQSSGSADGGLISPVLNATGNADRYSVAVTFPVEMRTSPTMVYYGGRSGVADTADRVSQYNGDNLRSFTTEPSSTPKTLRGWFDTGVADNAISFHFTADAEI